MLFVLNVIAAVFIHSAQGGGGKIPSTNVKPYFNVIADFTPPKAYTEICFKSGGVYADIHWFPESTRGGHCRPGDRGFIIEKSLRPKSKWTEALRSCLQDGMRLVRPFEWKLACVHNEDWVIHNMLEDEWEWASNTARAMTVKKDPSVVSHVFGKRGCNSVDWQLVGYPIGYVSTHRFRCAR